MGLTRLVESFVICVLKIYSLMDQFRLGGSHILVLSCVCISLPYSLNFHFIVNCGWIWLRVV